MLNTHKGEGSKMNRGTRGMRVAMLCWKNPREQLWLESEMRTKALPSCPTLRDTP